MKSLLEKLKKCETARNFNSDIGRILPKKSKLKFEEFCRKIEDYNIMHKAASMEVRKIMNKHIGELEEKFIPEENKTKLLNYIRREVGIGIRYESFCEFFYKNFHEEIMKQILNNKEIDKMWFMKYATGKYHQLRLEAKEEIVDLIEGRFLICSCGYKKAYEGNEEDEEEKNCPNCGKKLEFKRISFEGILKEIKETLKKMNLYTL